MDNRGETIVKAYREQFGGAPTGWVRAPGRVDLMGSHTDYNEGYVLTMPLNLDTWIAFSPRNDGKVVLYSLNLGEGAEFLSSVPYTPEQTGWITYISGVAQVLRDAGYDFPGINGVIQSTVPLGGGLSSSASLECAAAEMFMKAGGFTVEKKQTALYCQQAENKYAGLPCGILDQYTSVMGKKGTLILLDCRSLSHILIKLPQDIQVVICDTQAPHILVGSEYEARRNQCFQGVKIIRNFYPDVHTLRDVDNRQLRACKHRMDETVFKRCSFITGENQRVLDASAALSAGTEEEERLAGLFGASFQGSKDLYEITVPQMEMMQDAMTTAPGVIASRQAGGGFGGCMVSLVHAEQTADFRTHVVSAYKGFSGLEAVLYAVSPGEGAGEVVL